MLGRRPHDEPHRKKTFYLPESLTTRIDLMLELDLARGTPKHGQWSSLITHLLRKWLEEQETASQSQKGDNAA